MTIWRDEDTVLVSAIEHYSYCPRQCALIHVEKVFDENIFTVRGSMAHERADEPIGMEEHGVRVEKALPIWSDVHGLYGKADIVEFRDDGAIFPVEYKHGPKRGRAHDELQLCAQALCLEEMFGVPVDRGAVFQSSSQARREVEFTQHLRARTLDVVRAIREMLNERVLPPPVDDNRCPDCSLVDACMPSGIGVIAATDTARYLFVPVDSEVPE